MTSKKNEYLGNNHHRETTTRNDGSKREVVYKQGVLSRKVKSVKETKPKR